MVATIEDIARFTGGGSLALIVADLDDHFYAPFVKAAQRQARRRRYQIYFADTDNSPAVEESLVRSLAGTVDGILLCSPHQDDSSIKQLARDVPVVVINRTITDVPAVVADIAGGVCQAIEHLADLGHRNLAYVGGHRGSWTDHEIRRAAIAAATARDVRISVLGPFAPVPFGSAAAAQAIRSDAATGVLACNDLVAVGLLEALRSAGVDVPRGVSLIGIDDSPLAGIVELTTVATPAASAGAAAVDLLLHHAGRFPAGGGNEDRSGTETLGRGPTQVFLPTTLIARKSSGPGPYGGLARSGDRLASSSHRPEEL